MSGVKTARLSDFCATGSGGTPSRSKLERYYEGGTIPWIKSGELRESVITHAEEYVTDVALKESSIKLVPTGAILLAMYGATVGRLGILGIEATTNQAVCHIVPDPTVAATRYVYHALSSQVPNLISMGVGGAQPNINQGIIKGLVIPLPPLPEQRRIAAILDQADALRAKRREALAQLDSLTQSIFIEMFGDPLINPKNWPLCRLDSLFSASPIFGTMIPGVVGRGRHLCLRVANIQNWQLDLSDQKFVDLPPSTLDRHSVKDGDLLLARAIATQELLGKCIVARPGKNQWAFDSHLMRLRFRSDRVEPDFIRQALRTSGGRSIFLASSRKSTVQYNINTKEIAALQLPIPPLNLQQDFLERLQAIDSLKVAQNNALFQSDTLFASLQHRAFQGEL